MEVTDDTFELLERRLAERVEERVRSRLFAFYGSVGGAIMLVVGFFGYDVIQSTRENAIDYAKEAVDAYAKETVGPTVTEAAASAAAAKEQAQAAAAIIEVLNDFMGRGSQKLSDMEVDVQKRLTGIGKAARDQEAALEGISGKLKATEETLNDQRERGGQLYAGQGDLKLLADEVIELSKQVQTLEAFLTSTIDISPAAGPDDTTPPPDKEQSAAQVALDTIIENSEAIVPVTENAQKPTVYIQFAGVERDVASALADALGEQNFTMPGEERTGVAAGLHEVRFFFEDDKKAAERLVIAANGWLTDNGYEANVTIRDATSYGKAKPKPGVLELWLEPKPV